MPILFDAAAHTAGGSTNPLTWNHTCSGTNRVLIVAIGTNGQPALDVTYGGTPMTSLGSRQEGTTGYRVSLWKLPGAATGTNQVRASLSAAAAYSVASSSFTGVDQVDVNGVFASSIGAAVTSHSLAVSSSAGEKVIDALVWNQNANPSTESVGPQQTERGGTATGAFVRCALSTESGSATTTMSWGLTSATNVTHCGISLRPVSNTGIAFATQATVANSTAGKTITISTPPSLATGDVMLAMLAWTGNIAIIDAVPTGWTVIASATAGPASDASAMSLTTYYKIAATEGASYTWSLSGASVQNCGAIWRITGALTASALDVSSINSDQGAQLDAATVTTNYNNDMVVFVGAYNSGQAGFSFTPPSGYTSHTDIETAGNARLLGVEKIQIGAGATGAPFALGNNAVASDYCVAQLICIRALAAAVDAIQEGAGWFPTNITLYHRAQYPRGYAGWLNKDVSPDVLLAVTPPYWTQTPRHLLQPPQPRPGIWSGPPVPNAASPSPSGTPSQSLGPRISLPPPTLKDKSQWQRQAAAWMGEANKGHLQNTGIITLAANANSTVVADERAGANSYVDFMPRTSDAALEKSGGTLYISSQGKGTFTITHSNNTNTNRTFVYSILG